MKSKYIAASDSFQEQNELPPPQGNDLQYNRDYAKHIQSLRNIPCRPGDKWQEGFVYEEHLDYTVYEYSDENRIHRIEIVPVNIDDEDIYDAVRRKRNQIDTPAPSPTTEQTELWKEVQNEILEAETRKCDAMDDIKWGIVDSIQSSLEEKLSNKYSITRKQEVPEAVEFAEWCVEFYGWSDTDELWVDNQEKKYTTAELFQLFKTPTNAPAHPH